MEQIFEKKINRSCACCWRTSDYPIHIRSNVIFNYVDTELNRLEKLTENDIEKMRAQRLESMKQDHKKRQEWLANGKF